MSDPLCVFCVSAAPSSLPRSPLPERMGASSHRKEHVPSLWMGRARARTSRRGAVSSPAGALDGEWRKAAMAEMASMRRSSPIAGRGRGRGVASPLPLRVGMRPATPSGAAPPRREHPRATSGSAVRGARRRKTRRGNGSSGGHPGDGAAGMTCPGRSADGSDGDADGACRSRGRRVAARATASLRPAPAAPPIPNVRYRRRAVLRDADRLGVDHGQHGHGPLVHDLDVTGTHHDQREPHDAPERAL